jgi:MoaA/NifB/PqqE/SkfB family radical SAM enzyme
MSIHLSQSEADLLVAMPKKASTSTVYLFPQAGGKLIVELQSTDDTEQFILDINRSRIKIGGVTYQNRAREIVILRRLDIEGPPHRNPDGEVIPCPHLHMYREGFGAKWAYPVPEDTFTNLADRARVLEDFLTAINTVEPPQIQMGLF